MDFVIPTAAVGALGWVIVILTYLGKIPPYVGYPLGGALVSIQLLTLAVGLKSVREFKKRPPPSAGVKGKRGVVVEIDGGWALVKIEGAYWRVYCPNCSPGDEVEVVDVGDLGLEVRRV